MMVWYLSFLVLVYEELMGLATDEPEWIIEQAKARKRRELLRQRQEMEARLAKVRAKEKAQREKYLREPSAKRRRTDDKANGGKEDDEEQFVLDDYDSDREGNASFTKGSAANGLSAENLALMEKLGLTVGAPKEEEEEVEDETKVCSSFSLEMIC
jgi:chromosome transmission fidelity protein 1